MDDSEDDDSDEDDNEDLDALEVIGQKSNKRKCNKHWLPKSKAKVIKQGRLVIAIQGLIQMMPLVLFILLVIPELKRKSRKRSWRVKPK